MDPVVLTIIDRLAQVSGRAAIAALLASTFWTAPSAARNADASCVAGPVVAMDPATQPLPLGTQSYPRTLKLCDHRVVLTFDDGPAPHTTPMILDALRDAGVKASFFLIGRNACAHEAIARREVDEGHTVGHHSNTHPSFTLRGFDEASAERDIADGIAADEEAIYGPKATPETPHVPFFRFPGFADTPDLLHRLAEHRIGVLGSDLWAGDWLAMTPERERRIILDRLERRPDHAGILLLHDPRMSTALMLPGLLSELKARGYEIVQLVYQRGAPAPPLTEPLTREPEAKRVIDNLPTPIVPGTHHLAGSAIHGCPVAVRADSDRRIR